MDAMTTTDAARILNVSSRTVARASEKHGIGYKANESLRLLTQEDVEKLRGLVSNRVGNPAFGDPQLASEAAKKRWAPKKRAVAKKASPVKRKPKAD